MQKIKSLSNYCPEISDEKTHDEELIMNALNQGDFIFYLQPKINLANYSIVGVEALARMQLPNGKILFPDSFIDLLEKNGQIVKLDYLILEKVCQYIRNRIDKGLSVITTSVNLSRLHILNENHPKELYEIVSKYDIPTNLIQFELTENIYIDEFTSARNFSEGLRYYGFSRAIDDFGAGCSGINMWRYLEFEEMKLDRSFLMEDPYFLGKNIIIISGIAKIAHELNVNLLAEGIEEISQCQKLLDAGCGYGQGFLFSKPIPPDEFYEAYHHNSGIYKLSA